MPPQSDAVEEVIGTVSRTAGDRDEVSVGNISDALGARGYGPFLFLPALLELTPIGGIPGVPTLLAAIIIVFAAQIALGRDSMWLPDILRRRAISADRIDAATDRLMPVARWLDRWFPGRLPAVTGTTARRAAAVLSLLLCLTVPPLELLPFASSAPMGAIALFGLAMTLRDGVLMCLGFAVAAGAVAMMIGVL